jgi:two-component system, NarL family, nitrate/nitrite response regulator NarL
VSITVAIADDNPVLRDLFRRHLETMPGIQVVGEATDGDCAMDVAETLRPDVLLADTCMPGPNGKYLARLLQDKVPGTAVLVLMVPEDCDVVSEALAAGARGCLPKRCVQTDLLKAIRTVASGGTYMPAHCLPEPGWVQQLFPVASENCAG